METPSKWRRITDSPTLTLIATYLPGFIASAAGLAVLWEFITGENLNQFLIRKGWEVTMPSWYYSFVIVLLCLMVMLQIKLTRVVLARRRDFGWLEKLAQWNDEEMANIVRLRDQEISMTSVLNALDPYVIFHMPIFNGSIYDLTLEEKVEGHFSIGGTEGLTPLIDEPKIHQVSGLSKHIKAQRGRCVNVLIRQKIPNTLVDYIQAEENAAFWVNSICVQFTYRNYTGTHKTLPIKITGISIHLPKVQEC